MKVQTYLFGEVEVNPDSIITFPNGLAGFEDKQRFMLVHESSHDEPASYTLQSLEDPNLAFQIVDTGAVGFHYELALTDGETALLKNPAAGDVVAMLILYKQESDAPVSLGANIRAPLIINTKARVGVQKLIEKMRSNVTISNLASNV